VVGGDLAPSGGQATFTANKTGTAFIRAAATGMVSTPSGLLTVVAGEAVKVRAETAANGSGVVVTSHNVTAGTTQQLYAVTRDVADNFTGNLAATWTMTTTGGVVASDLSPISPTTAISATFTAHQAGTAIVTPHVTGLTSVSSGTLTVIAGTATKVRVETAANGSGSVVAAQTITAGDSIVVYAITRDSNNNFVANPSATWSVITRTLGVTTTDLVPIGGGGSAVFTAHKVGTGGIQATFGILTKVPSGLLSVVAGDAVKVRAETAANGSGSVVATQNVTAGQTRRLFAISRDVADNFIANVSADWTVTRTGGVASTAITPTTGLSTTFSARLVGTAIIAPDVAGLDSVPSGRLTVVAGTATKVRVETSATGSGTVVAAQDITAGQSITVYAISRDSFNNFVANPSATWAMTRTGGVLTSDLTSSGGRATLTGHAIGTAIIVATSGALSKTPSGLLTVVAGNPVYLDITTASGTATSASTTAGALLPLKITAYDAGNNVATGYNGTKNLLFSGALPSTNPVRQPAAVDANGSQHNFSANTPLTFVSGVLTTTNNAGAIVLFRSGSNIAINVADASNPSLDSTPNGTFIATVAADDLYRLVLSLPNTALTAGVPVSLTITAQDQYGNTQSSYGSGNGNNGLIFSSTTAITAPNGRAATVQNRNNTQSGNTKDFGESTDIHFNSTGVATTSAGTNGVLTIYKAGTFRLNVSDDGGLGVPTSSPPFDQGAGYLTVTVANSPNQSIVMTLATPQTDGLPFTGSNAITLTDTYQNPVVINAATRPVTLTTSLNGVLTLNNSGHDNVLNETDDFTSTTGQANLTLLGLVYTGTVGTGRITATVSSPAGGFISSGATVRMIPGTPKKLRILGKTGNGTPSSNVTVSAGTPISLEIRAFDAGNNATTNFTNTMALIFSAPTASGTVRDSGNNTVTLGSSTPINFLSGVARVQSNGSNGRLVITAGSPTIIVKASSSGVSTPDANALVVNLSANITGAEDPNAPSPGRDRLFLPLVPKEEAPHPGAVDPTQVTSSGVYLPSVHN